MSDWCPLYMDRKVQVRLCLMLYRPVPNLFKILARVRSVYVSQHLLLLLAPFPENGAYVRRALQRLPELLVAVLHVEDVVFCLCRVRCHVDFVDIGVCELAHHIQTMELVKDIEFHNVAARIVCEGGRCVGELSCRLGGDLRN